MMSSDICLDRRGTAHESPALDTSRASGDRVPASWPDDAVSTVEPSETTYQNVLKGFESRRPHQLLTRATAQVNCDFTDRFARRTCGHKTLRVQTGANFLLFGKHWLIFSMQRLIFIAALGLITLGAADRPTSEHDLVFLTRDGCVNTPYMVNNLDDALTALGWPKDYQFINIGKLSKTDVRNGYPTPTLLWKGRDIFGLPVREPLSAGQARPSILANLLPRA
jgi:hypothetical protein